MGDIATARILKEILDELKKLNQKLDLKGEEVRGKADVKSENQDDENIVTPLDTGVESRSAGTTENDKRDEEGADPRGATESLAASPSSALEDGVASEMTGDHVLVTQGANEDAEVLQVAMSGGLESAGRPDIGKDRSDDGRVDSSTNVTNVPATISSQALVEKTSNNGDSSELEATEEQAEKEVTFRYRWNGPSYGTPNPDDYPPLSEATQDRWSKLLPFWGIPDDHRIPLTLDTPYLVSLPDDQADEVLKTVRGYIEELESKGSSYSRFTIKDYLPDGRIWSYFDNAAGATQSNRPDEEIRIQFEDEKYPLPEIAPSLAPWRRFM